MIEIKNFISNIQSDNLIAFHKSYFDLNKESCRTHRNTQVIDPPVTDQTKEIYNMLTGFIKTINSNLQINYFEIVKWPTGEFQDEHVDFDYHPYTSILYLNDDYKGGETIVSGATIQPEKNKLIGFEGVNLTHSVNQITEGTRYTVPCWYRHANV
tara:strand:- start:7 stop:471 length:465 start_codon:yes stop_codon:yes gene_type:complete